VVTPVNGTLSFRMRDGTKRSHNMYIADAVGTFVKIAKLGKAGTGSPMGIQFEQDAIFEGASVLTGPTVIFTLECLVAGKSQGTTVSIAENLNTLANRPSYNVRIPAGAQFDLVEY